MPSIIPLSFLTESQFDKLAKEFQCTESALSDYLRRFAYKHSKEGLSQTYCLINDDANEIIAYITMVSSVISDKEGDAYTDVKNECNIKGYRFPIPAIKIARLATDNRFTKQGYGSVLISIAKIKGYIAQFNEGCRILTVDSKNDAVEFYRKNGFFKLSMISDSKTELMYTVLTPLKKLTSESINEFIEFCQLFNFDEDARVFKRFLEK